MAANNGTNYAKILDPSSDNILAEGLNGGRVRCAVDNYTTAATAIADTIRIAKLPVGAKVLQIDLEIVALGASVTLDIGDEADDDRYLVAGDGNTAGNLVSNLGTGYVVGTTTGDDVIILTVGGATATGEIKSVVYYTAD